MVGALIRMHMKPVKKALDRYVAGTPEFIRAIGPQGKERARNSSAKPPTARAAGKKIA